MARSEPAFQAANPAEYLKLARMLEANRDARLRPVRVAFLASFTAETLRPYLLVEAARRGLALDCWFAPFNQFEQQALDGASPLYAAQNDLLVVAFRLEELDAALATGTLRGAAAEPAIRAACARIEALLAEIRKRSAAALLVWNFAPLAAAGAGLAEAKAETSLADIVAQANSRLAAVCRKCPGAHVFDAHGLAVESGLRAWLDPRLYLIGRIPFSADAQIRIAGRLVRYLAAIVSAPRKCLVLDLDNTLWGGVVGEDGVGGIKLGEEFPGNAYKAFQRYLLQLRSRGILLAIASKNNPEDVREVFDKHPDCLLKLADFAATDIGWGDKAGGLRRIAAALNIGVEALAFFDDNPFEREQVRAELPQVLVVDAPPSPVGFADAVEASGAFDALEVSTEDFRRAAMYSEQAQRQQLEQSSGSLAEFLAALDMRATCGTVDAATLPRVAQLIAKTNQFNTTTRRYTAAELQRFLDSGAIGIWMRLEDRFGDNGLIGVCIAKPGDKGAWCIDALLLSCRVIGRGAETVLLAVISDLVRARGASALVGEFIPTPKNAPAREVFAQAGFDLEDKAGRLWRWDLTRATIAMPAHIRVESGESANV